MKNYNLIVVIGATASGKTRLAVELANKYDGEIISADSRQVYKGLDIGTGKDLVEYGNTPYHLIDIIDPDKEYNAFQYQQDFSKAYQDIVSQNKQAILVGGTGLYIDAVVNGYEFVQVKKDVKLRDELAQKPLDKIQRILLELDDGLYGKTDINVRSRLYRAIEIARARSQPKTDIIATQFTLPKIKPLYFAIKWDRKRLRQRITLRLKQRLEQGMVEEVQALLSHGISHEKLDYFGLEYRFVSQYLAKNISYNEMFEKLNIAIHQYAKRQDTWFRRIEKKGAIVHWLDGREDVYQLALHILAKQNVEK